MACCLVAPSSVADHSIAFSISHPSLVWLYVFSSFPQRPPRPPLQRLLPLTSKLFELNLRYLGQRIHRSGEMYWMTFPWSWPKVTAVASISKNLLVCTIKWKPIIRSLQNIVAIWPMVVTSLDFRAVLFWQFLKKNLDVFFFKVIHCFGHISGMVGPIDVKWKGNASVGYRVWYVTFDLTYDFDLGCFKGKFWNSCISGIVGLIDVKWKGSELMDTGLTIWPCPLTTPLTLSLEFQHQSLK